MRVLGTLTLATNERRSVAMRKRNEVTPKPNRARARRRSHEQVEGVIDVGAFEFQKRTIEEALIFERRDERKSSSHCFLSTVLGFE